MFVLRIVFTALSILYFIALGVTSLGIPHYSKIENKLQTSFETRVNVGIFITMKQPTDDILELISSQRFNSRVERINKLVHGLKLLSIQSQKSVQDFLKMESVLYESFWISNQIYIPNATVTLVSHLANHKDILAISEETISYIPELKISEIVYTSSNSTYNIQWGVSKVMADHVWRRTGNTGEGIVVGIIDTGVRGSHNALRDNFRTPYGWRDPSDNDINGVPTDVHGHGTHCTGVMVGSKGIGVSPGSKWIACKGCSSGSCLLSELIFCGQWMLCPTLPDGSKEDCSKAPHLVSNSWAAAQGHEFFNSVVNAWKAARIFPIFGLGNAGPVCNTARSPADSSSDVIGVGATTSGDSLASFSSRGPSVHGMIKPDISAPGDYIYSSYSGADNAYATMSGTSMATPHVAGAVALILSKGSNLTYAEVKHFLFKGSDTTELIQCDELCGGIDGSVYPNNCYGHGRLNVFNSISLM